MYGPWNRGLSGWLFIGSQIRILSTLILSFHCFLMVTPIYFAANTSKLLLSQCIGLGYSVSNSFYIIQQKGSLIESSCNHFSFINCNQPRTERSNRSWNGLNLRDSCTVSRALSIKNGIPWYNSFWCSLYSSGWSETSPDLSLCSLLYLVDCQLAETVFI